MLAMLAITGSMVMSALTAPAVAVAATSPMLSAPPTDRVVIELATVKGSGCPTGTAGVAVSLDNTAFTVTYDQYMAKVGYGAGPTDWRKFCQLSIVVHVPQGFTYAIAKADFRGFASLQLGARAVTKASYYFTGDSNDYTTEHSFNGALEDNWQTTDTREITALVFAECGEEKNMNIHTELRVHAGTSDPITTTSFISMDSTDTSFTTKYHFAWKECPPPPPTR